MTDLSKRIRENLLTDPRGLDLLGGRTSLLREAADALDQPTWQPISKAPMDGTPVLVFCPNEEPQMVAAKYVTDSEWSGWVFVEMLLQETMPEGPEGPTHFMPLPTPPEDE